MFSKSTEYALRATIYIAQKSNEEKKLSIGLISKAIGSPASFTAKILQNLTRAKIVNAVRGPNGGFYLTQKAKKLSVRSILEAMNEDKILKKCVLGLKKCSEEKPCPMHNQYKFIKENLVELFESKTIGMLAEEIKNGESFIK
jgi:Rrf2 family protein